MQQTNWNFEDIYKSSISVAVAFIIESVGLERHSASSRYYTSFETLPEHSG